MGDIGSEPYEDGEHVSADHRRDSRHRQPDRPREAVLSDAEAERLLNGGWALNARPLGAVDETGTENREHLPKPTDLPDLGISAVAGRPARMAYSAGWDGADDPGGHAAWRPDRSAGSTDSGGEMTVSSVDFPTDLASPDAQAVARLLAAATAPPGADELRGYEVARRAFERAGATPVRRGAGLPLRRLIGVKVVAAAGVLTVTGVAVAAEADVLPSPLQRVAHQMLGGVGVPDPEPDAPASDSVAGGSSSSSARPGTPHPTGSSAGGTTGPGATVPGTPTGTLNPSSPGSSGSSAETDALALCRSYTAQQAGTGAALSGHDRRRLATLAGGEDRIADFCARTLQAAPTQSSPTSDDPVSSTVPSPSKDHKPTDTPSSAQPPASTGSPGGNGDGHAHTTPSPTHPSHLNKS